MNQQMDRQSRICCLVDCSYHFRAAYFALPDIYSPDGKLVNAVYGFVSILLKLLRDRRPTMLGVADDAPGRYFRHEIFPAYKSDKTRVPAECDEQMPILRSILEAMAIPYFVADGFEADDVIATLTQKARQLHYKVYICSRDKDLEQLVQEGVSILNVSSGEETTAEAVKDRRGVEPVLIPDMLALTGDKVDSIPGVPGVGQRTASRLLRRYGSLESVLAHYHEISGKMGSRIRDLSQQALLAKELTTLRRDVPLADSSNAFGSSRPKKDVIESVLRQLGFDKLWHRFEAIE